MKKLMFCLFVFVYFSNCNAQDFEKEKKKIDGQYAVCILKQKGVVFCEEKRIERLRLLGLKEYLTCSSSLNKKQCEIIIKNYCFEYPEICHDKNAMIEKC